MRLDVLVTLLPPERSLAVAPHGILGQSFDGSGIAVDGAVDPKPQPGELMTTKAMAEGSIEGVWHHRASCRVLWCLRCYEMYVLERNTDNNLKIPSRPRRVVAGIPESVPPGSP